ncbi:MAG: SCO family protein [Candidatus Paracaedibacteraceae bacterium]|nr:SCO family protein [Candidatus Paracaedibacteraceae bacterium]
MNKIRWLIYIFFITFLCGLIIYLQSTKKPISYVMDKQTIETKAFGGDFTLINTSGASFSMHEIRGKFAILYFGYTFCPDICPLGLSNISKALASLERDRDQFVPIFITVDPKRDTSDLLKIYATNFDPAFIMLTGSNEVIESVKDQYHVYAKSIAHGNSYLVDHSTYIYLLDRNGKFIKHIPHDMEPAIMKKVFVELLTKSTTKIKQ